MLIKTSHKKFDWKINKKFNWKLLLSILLVTTVIYGIETFSYFYVAIWAGQLFNRIDANFTLNMQLPFDKIIPWQTWILPYYLLWPYVWFVLIPLIIYLINGKIAYYKYCVNSLLAYLIGMFLYLLIPTTCSPSQFMKCNTTEGLNWDYSQGAFVDSNNVSWGGIILLNHGHYNLLQPGDLFYKEMYSLSSSPLNIWGASPSYHNYWASLFVFFGFSKGIKWYFRILLFTLGIMITYATLGLHQHNLADVLFTYSITGLCFWLISSKNLDVKFEIFLKKLFKVKMENVNVSITK
ncbi:MAG: hypothetical protein LBB39_00100 [Mycoplasmataceae bacterium]|jgi:hypothetical protein|nr:hypothetical protein [Mycoplasmataceae bacterium]